MRDKLIVLKNTFAFFLKKVGAWLSIKQNKAFAYLSFLSLNLFTLPLTVGASEGDVDANALWNLVMEFILTWVPRLGFVLLFVGGVEFAIAYQQQDANGKTNATRLMVSGAMVIAIPLALGNLIRI